MLLHLCKTLSNSITRWLRTNVSNARRKLFLQIWKSGSSVLIVEARFSTSQEAR